VRGYKNRGESGLIEYSDDVFVAIVRCLDGLDQVDTPHPPDVGETMPSNIDSGDAGRSGAAIGNSACGSKFCLCGGSRKGFIGERGMREELGEWSV
jgi:hypothetical protein